MPHRIEIELTSQVSPESWTWRAAGARQPRGTVAASLVPGGTVPGTVLRAEVETTLDGTTVVGLLARKGKDAPRDDGRIEVIGTSKPAPDVNVVLASKPRGGNRGSRPDRDPGQRNGSRTRRERSTAPVARSSRPRSEHSNDRTDRPVRPSSRTTVRGERGSSREGSRGSGPSTVYRNATLADLKPEQLPVAEQLLRGGLPAVRQAIEEQNARARADGRAEVSQGPLLALAEQLLPAVTLAAWKDRAATATTLGKDVSLRELRSVVASSSTVNLDEEARTMASALRASLEGRVTALRERWANRITAALDGNQVIEALQASVRPPEPATRLPAALAVRLADAAGKELRSDVDSDHWAAVLAAVVESPVRRTVKPAGLPVPADEQIVTAARHASGLVPELARLLGIPIPPPPGPRRSVPARPAPSRRSH